MTWEYSKSLKILNLVFGDNCWLFNIKIWLFKNILIFKFVTLNGDIINSENLIDLLLFIGAEIVWGLHSISLTSKGILCKYS